MAMMNNNMLSLRAAVSLNNMGICTMEQGHFGAAMETLKDSLLVMKNILNQPFHERTTLSLERRLQDKLEAARLRLAQSQAQPLHHPSIEIRACDDGNVMAMKVPLTQGVHYGPPPKAFIPIRLFESSSHQLPNLEAGTIMQQGDDIFKIPSAVILYNHGLTHMLAHIQNKKSPKTPNTTIRTTTAPESQESLLHGGFVCFTMAYDILGQERRGAGVKPQHKHAALFEMLQATLISGLIFHNLFYVFRMNFQIQEAEDALHGLSSLLFTIQIHEDALRDMNVELQNCKTACAA
jgi:hypothetical protein